LSTSTKTSPDVADQTDYWPFTAANMTYGIEVSRDFLTDHVVGGSSNLWGFSMTDVDLALIGTSLKASVSALLSSIVCSGAGACSGANVASIDCISATVYWTASLPVIPMPAPHSPTKKVDGVA
jgi:hypothetical protein